MATHYGGLGQPLDRVTNMIREEQPVVDTNIEVLQDFHPEDTDHFEDLEHNNPTRVPAITTELDDLCQRIQAEEGQPTASLYHIEQSCNDCPYHSTHLHILNPLGRVKALHEHSVFSTNNKLHKFLTTGYIYLHWT